MSKPIITHYPQSLLFLPSDIAHSKRMNISTDGFMLRALVTTAWLTIFYVVVGAIYRLYFSSIATFPGPTFTALTLWYEFYYDVITGGKFIWQIKRMHEKYGSNASLIVV